MKPDSQFGPIQNAKPYKRVQGLIEDAGREGKIIAGGKVAGPGFFVRPTIVRDVADNARIVREEQFGPILPLLRYKDIDDAINRANDTDYGLGATVWGKDTKRAAEIAMKIKSGVVWVNSHMNITPMIPMGGAKQSGMGLELGQEGLTEFTQRHLIYAAN